MTFATHSCTIIKNYYLLGVGVGSFAPSFGS